MWVAGLTVYPTLGRVVFVLYYLFLFSSHNFLDKIFFMQPLCATVMLYVLRTVQSSM